MEKKQDRQAARDRDRPSTCPAQNTRTKEPYRHFVGSSDWPKEIIQFIAS